MCPNCGTMMILVTQLPAAVIEFKCPNCGTITTYDIRLDKGT